MPKKILRVLGGVLGAVFVLVAIPISMMGPDSIWPPWVQMVTFFGIGVVFLHYSFTGRSRLFRARSYDEENKFVDKALSELRNRSLDQLRSLPRQEDLDGPQEYADIKYCRWVDSLADGGVRVVIQAYQKRWLGAGRMAATGFDMSADGPLTDLGEPGIFEYL